MVGGGLVKPGFWLGVFLAVPGLLAQSGANVLVVVNRRDAESRAIGNYYRPRRSVPVKNVCYLDTTSEEEIQWGTYVREVEEPIARCLADGGLELGRELVAEAWRGGAELAAGRRLDGGAQPQRVGDDDCAAPPLDQPAALHGVNFARDGFAARVDAGGEFGLVRRRDDDCPPRVVAVGTRKTKEFGVNTGANVERAQFADPAGHGSQPRDQRVYNGFAERTM